jgi:hypothetical protein
VERVAVGNEGAVRALRRGEVLEMEEVDSIVLWVGEIRNDKTFIIKSPDKTLCETSTNANATTRHC